MGVQDPRRDRLNQIARAAGPRRQFLKMLLEVAILGHDAPSVQTIAIELDPVPMGSAGDGFGPNLWGAGGRRRVGSPGFVGEQVLTNEAGELLSSEAKIMNLGPQSISAQGEERIRGLLGAF
jgi:hypothetical protein